MEGKAVLFKRFADVDSIDIELDTRGSCQAFIEAVALMEPSFGGINLEDIAAPECFIIEQALRERMNIPVMHDDQHGTAIIAAAGLINACHLTGRDLKDVRMVVNGAGASALACTALIKALGVPARSGDRLRPAQGRSTPVESGVDQWKSAHAVANGGTKPGGGAGGCRHLPRPVCGGRVEAGVGRAGWQISRSSSQWLTLCRKSCPTRRRRVRPDAIIATGRSDYPNQVNNVLGFPFIFRGALDVRATAINEEMKIAAAQRPGGVWRESAVPEEVAAAYGVSSTSSAATTSSPHHSIRA